MTALPRFADHAADVEAADRLQAAELVQKLAYASGLFGEAECDAAIEDSYLRGDFVIHIDTELEEWPHAHCRPLPDDLLELEEALTEYVRHDIDVRARAYQQRQRTPHSFKGSGAWCSHCRAVRSVRCHAEVRP